MADQRTGQSFQDPDTGFSGSCADGVCSGTFSDAGKFINVQEVMRFLRTVEDTSSAARLLASLDDALGIARMGTLVVNFVGTSIDQAQAAIDAARAALPFDVSDWRPALVDAGAKVVVVLNQLGAGSITLEFAKARLVKDINPLNDLSWLNYLVTAAVLLVGLLLAWKITR